MHQKAVFWKLQILKTWLLTCQPFPDYINNGLMKQIPKYHFGVEFSFNRGPSKVKVHCHGHCNNIHNHSLERKWTDSFKSSIFPSPSVVETSICFSKLHGFTYICTRHNGPCIDVLFSLQICLESTFFVKQTIVPPVFMLKDHFISLHKINDVSPYHFS